MNMSIENIVCVTEYAKKKGLHDMFLGIPTHTLSHLKKDTRYLK